MADINILQELVGKTIKSISFDRENDSDPAGAVMIQCTDNSDYEISSELNTQALAVEKITEESLTWTQEDNHTAQKEGWDIFNAGDELQIQRIDELKKFDCDEEVWMFLVSANTPLHDKALTYIKQENPAEYDRIINYHKKSITNFVEEHVIEHAKLSIDGILESNYFWEDKNIAVKRVMLIYGIDGLKTETLSYLRTEVVSYLKKQKNYDEIINSVIDEQLETDVHDIVYEFFEDKYNRAYANFIEAIEFSLLNNVLGGLNDEFIPDNFIDIVSFVSEDVLKSNFIKDSDKGYWNVDDLKLAFRRWMESNE